MAKIVWVYGSSAAGKQTFIQRVVVERIPVVIDLFGWQDLTIGACIPSLAWVAYRRGDTIATRRSRLPDVITDMANIYDVVLIKGQDWDLSHRLPQKVKQMLPNAQHSIIFIDVSLDEIYSRIVRKRWWDPRTRRAEEEGWLQEQLDNLNQLATTFEIAAINGSVHGHYELVPFSHNSASLRV